MIKGMGQNNFNFLEEESMKSLKVFLAVVLLVVSLSANSFADTEFMLG